MAGKYHTCTISWTSCRLQTLLWYPSSNGELFVTIQLNPLPAYDCITTMDVSLNISGAQICSHYNMYEVSDNSFVENVTQLTACIQTIEEPSSLYTYCQYRCRPSVNLMFGWSGSVRLQNVAICDLRWNYDTCWIPIDLMNTLFRRSPMIRTMTPAWQMPFSSSDSITLAASVCTTSIDNNTTGWSLKVVCANQSILLFVSSYWHICINNHSTRSFYWFTNSAL